MCTQIGFRFPVILNKGLCFKIKALALKYPKFLSVFLVCPFYFLNSPIICSKLHFNINLIKPGLKQLAHFTRVNSWHGLLGGKVGCGARYPLPADGNNAGSFVTVHLAHRVQAET